MKMESCMLFIGRLSWKTTEYREYFQSFGRLSSLVPVLLREPYCSFTSLMLSERRGSRWWWLKPWQAWRRRSTARDQKRGGMIRRPVTWSGLIWDYSKDHR
ncbi:hypothetical protein N665_0305s0034 [Sinapis alba]|nr:hypothetical protein N665_0305s0034 [Sinapis alba]